MTDLDREERAFRAALSAQATEAPHDQLTAPTARARRSGRIAVLTGAAACILTLVVLPLAFNRDDDESGPARPDPSEAVDPDTQWVAFHGIEVAAPADWAYDYEAIRPDCISDPSDPKDAWAQDVPKGPYVTLGGGARVVPAVGCFADPPLGAPDPAFGQLPFELWQPYVKLDLSRPELAADDPARADGSWQYRDWVLTRRTFDDVQVSVLAPPGRTSLGEKVLASTRSVDTTALGCETASPAQSAEFARPSGAPVPAAEDVGAVAICQYSRLEGAAGLEGSRRITGVPARELTQAVLDAPGGGGPDRPRNCTDDMYGDYSVAVRFFGDGEESRTLIGEAYVYFDWCFGNGIFDSSGARTLTGESCAPLFSKPPVALWSGQEPVFAMCHGQA